MCLEQSEQQGEREERSGRLPHLLQHPTTLGMMRIYPVYEELRTMAGVQRVFSSLKYRLGTSCSNSQLGKSRRALGGRGEFELLS